jgi:hypothetical protein
MKSFIWILPVILFVAVMAAVYSLELAQNKSNNLMTNSTGTSGEKSSTKSVDISISNTKNSIVNSTIGNSTR